MPKNDKKTKTKLAYTIEPWSCVHRSGRSQIEAYVMAAGKRAIVAETFATAGHTAETLAEFIVLAVNSLAGRENLIDEMEAALEICLECGGLNWSAEHDAELALRHAKARTQF